mmetsp:Transcript_55377/g.140765  ORF Transcript_55377/g.140765 Transcript_55377/m.140765 type:complete len:103 (-) Transcript_55377:86-394(-)
MLASLKLHVWERERELGPTPLQCTVLTEDRSLAVPRAKCTLWENGQRLFVSTLLRSTLRCYPNLLQNRADFAYMLARVCRPGRHTAGRHLGQYEFGGLLPEW